MDNITLNASLREDMGKGASRRLRHADKLPAIVYGAGKDPVSITLEQKDVQHKLPDEHFYSQVLSLVIDGNSEDVLLRDIQHHPYRMEVMHMDFIRVDANQVVHVHTPLHFSGDDVSPGVKQEGGAISHMLMEVELECLPKDIPEFIEVDLSEISVGEIVHLSDLNLPEGVSVVALKHGEEHDAAVVSCHPRKVAADEGGADAADAGDAGDTTEEGGQGDD